MFFAYPNIIYIIKKLVYYAVDHIYWQLSTVEIYKSEGACIYVHELLSFTTTDLDSYCKEHESEVCAVKLCIMSYHLLYNSNL
jgi:hypothetical protein